VTSFKIHLNESGKTFEAQVDETIMEAAEEAGIPMPHSCLSGICRACMTRVISGCVEHDPDYIDELNIDQFEIDEGYRLLCSALACSDVTLDK
jgi:ferredoxin